MSSERYEILQDDLESLLERIDASMEWVTKKTSGHNEIKSGLKRCQNQLDEARSYLSEMVTLWFNQRFSRKKPLKFFTILLRKLRPVKPQFNTKVK